MLDLAKLIVFCSVIWVMWLAIPVAGVLIGTVLALWVLYFFMQVAKEELDDGEEESHKENHR